MKKIQKIVDRYYIHTNTDKPYNLGNNLNFNKNFFDYSPAISGAVREHIFSKTEGSCISYKEMMNKVEPELAKEKTNFR